MTTIKVRNQYKMQQWAGIIKECRSSGLPVKQWCSQNNVPEGSYYYWLNKVRKQAMESFPANPSTEHIVDHNIRTHAARDYRHSYSF